MSLILNIWKADIRDIAIVWEIGERIELHYRQVWFVFFSQLYWSESIKSNFIEFQASISVIKFHRQFNALFEIAVNWHWTCDNISFHRKCQFETGKLPFSNLHCADSFECNFTSTSWQWKSVLCKIAPKWVKLFRLIVQITANVACRATVWTHLSFITSRYDYQHEIIRMIWIWWAVHWRWHWT